MVLGIFLQPEDVRAVFQTTLMSLTLPIICVSIAKLDVLRTRIVVPGKMKKLVFLLALPYVLTPLLVIFLGVSILIQRVNYELALISFMMFAMLIELWALYLRKN